MKRYFDLTKDEKLALGTPEFTDAVKLEAVHRGIKPPITMDERLNQGAYPSFTYPKDTTVFYELMRPDTYQQSATGVCFRTLEEAQAALKNVYAVKEDRYSKIVMQVITGEWSIRAVHVGSGRAAKAIAVEDYAQDDTAFDALLDECQKDWGGIAQAEYTAKANATKKAEYMRLAGGNEDIAKAFWAKTEKTEWPTAA